MGGNVMPRREHLPKAETVHKLLSQTDDFGKPLSFQKIAARLGVSKRTVSRLAHKTEIRDESQEEPPCPVL
jgi:DNA-binding MurR/RpiR family transcriptional regulator